MKIAIIVVMFLFIGAFFIISGNNLALGTSGNLNKFTSLYSSWISHLFDNSFGLAGYVVKMNWLPENQTG